jgi:hypothetical protein
MTATSGPGSTFPKVVVKVVPVTSAFALANGVTLFNVIVNSCPVTLTLASPVYDTPFKFKFN